MHHNTYVNIINFAKFCQFCSHSRISFISTFKDILKPFTLNEIAIVLNIEECSAIYDYVVYRVVGVQSHIDKTVALFLRLSC